MKKILIIFLPVFLFCTIAKAVKLGEETINLGSVDDPTGNGLPCTKSLLIEVYGENYDPERGGYWTMYQVFTYTITCTQALVVAEGQINYDFVIGTNGDLEIGNITLSDCDDYDIPDGDMCYDIMLPGDPTVHGNLTFMTNKLNDVISGL